MKPSEILFKFPIVAYDGVELQKRTEKELSGDAHEGGVQPYVIGYARLPISEIKGWHDGWRKGVSIQSIKEDIAAGKKGFDSTMVLTDTLGDYHCSWSMEKFEKNFDLHCEKIDAYEVEEAEKMHAFIQSLDNNSNTLKDSL